MGGRNSLIRYWHPLQLYISYGLTVQGAIDQGDFVSSEIRAQLREIFRPLNVTEYKDLLLFKYKGYTELADLGYGGDFFELHDGLYRECRSVVFNKRTKMVVLAALPKFKNFGEDESDWSKDNCWKKYSNAEKVYITNKMDGSYQQFTYDSKTQSIIGSGSQALDPELSWRLQNGYKYVEDNWLIGVMSQYPEWTFIFEYVSPDNPIVVKYDRSEEGLYLLAMRNKFTGEEMDTVRLNEIAKAWNLKITEYYRGTSLEEVLASTDKYSSSEKEGWVVNCVDKEGKSFRFKIKTDDYVLMHKALSNLISPNAVVEAIYNDRYDDFVAKCPDAYKEKVEKYRDEILLYYNLFKSLAYRYAVKVFEELGHDDPCKEVMLWINQNVPKCVRETTRAIILGKEPSFLTKNGGSLKNYTEIIEHYNQLVEYEYVLLQEDKNEVESE